MNEKRRVEMLAAWISKTNYLEDIMKQKDTKHKLNADLLEGDKLYMKRARLALPILVRQAKLEETISYSALAEEIEMPNPRNLNYVLGAIGNAIKELAKREKVEKIPIINCLVVNKANQLPGEGITIFIDTKNFDKKTKIQKANIIKRLNYEIYLYPNWDWVLNQLGLETIKTDYSKKLKPLILNSKGGFGGGESQQHKDFKNYLANHPTLFDLSSDLIGVTEYELPSLDKIDVRFESKLDIVGVEAKSIISDSGDILRGLFQCVKYKALIEAEQKVNDLIPSCRVVLALEGEFPKMLIGIRNQLGIEVLDKIKIDPTK